MPQDPVLQEKTPPRAAKPTLFAEAEGAQEARELAEALLSDYLVERMRSYVD